MPRVLWILQEESKKERVAFAMKTFGSVFYEEFVIVFEYSITIKK